MNGEKLDASVIAKWFLDEEGTEKALEIREKCTRYDHIGIDKDGYHPRLLLLH